MVGRLGMVVPVLPAWIFGGDGAGRVVARVAACRGAALGGVLVTVPPPPAVPGESRVNALAAEIRRVDPRHDLGAGALAEALLPFVGDIVEAARRDALTEVERALYGMTGRSSEWDDALDEALAAVADLAEHPAASLSATHADQDAENARIHDRGRRGNSCGECRPGDNCESRGFCVSQL